MKTLTITIIFVFCISSIYSHPSYLKDIDSEESDVEYMGTVGLNVGLNKANEILSSDNLYLNNSQIKARTTIQFGIVGQFKPYDGFGVGADLGFMLNQKGYSYNFETTTEDAEKPGYRIINHLEIPLNIRYYYALEGVSVSVIGGMYAGYAINGETAQTFYAQKNYIEFKDNKERFDYGYSIGFGVDAQVIGFDFLWSRGLKDNTYGYISPYTSRYKMFSVVLRLMIPSY